MPKIRILPEQIANQIAAGEVIERPASVVKELIENSLDAQADRIEIEIEGAGTRLIRIIDNGEGMDEDDVLLSLERHGTSKIKTSEDLVAIATLGFRGEAMPSIGSVSQLTILSRTAAAQLGTKASLHFGKLTAVTEMGCRKGSIVEVRNLFGQTPARKKFLRTTKTEVGHIEEVVKLYSLANPDTTFQLTIDGRQSLSLDSSLTIPQKLARILNYSGSFIEIEPDPHENSAYKVSGLLVPPEQTTSGQGRLRLFVNNRAVKDRVLTHAVAEGLRNFLMKGKNPVGLLHLTIPPEEVDVNVHPAKHEVRFRDAQHVHALVVNAINAAMQKEQRRLQDLLFGSGKPGQSSHLSPRKIEIIEDAPTLAEQHANWPAPAKDSPEIIPSKNRRIVPHDTQRFHTEGVGSNVSTPATPEMRPAENTLSEPVVPRQLKPEPLQHRIAPDGSTHHGLQVIGLFAHLYILCANEQGLLVIDQHAAHERLLFEEMRRQFTSKRLASQRLLFPVQVELSLLQSELVDKYQEEIHRMGFEIREFGGSTYLIAAIPALAGKIEAGELLLDVLGNFGAEQPRKSSGIFDSILAGLACKAAIKSGTSLSHREIDDLLNKMARAGLFSHCPHGRPVFRIFSHDDVKKWFHRT